MSTHDVTTKRLILHPRSSSSLNQPRLRPAGHRDANGSAKALWTPATERTRGEMRAPRKPPCASGVLSLQRPVTHGKDTSPGDARGGGSLPGTEPAWRQEDMAQHGLPGSPPPAFLLASGSARRRIVLPGECQLHSLRVLAGRPTPPQRQPVGKAAWKLGAKPGSQNTSVPGRRGREDVCSPHSLQLWGWRDGVLGRTKTSYTPH